MKRQESFRLQKAKRKILKFAANHSHAQAVGDRRVDIQGFARNAQLFFGLEVLQRAHIVQAVGQLHHDDANVIDHRQQHLADVFRLARFRRGHVNAADFGDAFDEVRHVGAETFFYAGDGVFGVFDGVVQERGRQCGGIHAHVGKDVGDLEQVRDIRIAGGAELVAVALGSYFIGSAHNPRIFGGTVFP